RAVRPDQQHRPGVRRPAGPGARHGGDHAAPAVAGPGDAARQPAPAVRDAGELSPRAAAVRPAHRGGAGRLARPGGGRDRRPAPGGGGVTVPGQDAGTGAGTGTGFPHRHLLAIAGLSAADITAILDAADAYVELNRQPEKKTARLRGRTVINLFFETSTRTRTSFELAGKRLGADTINMNVGTSSIKKGETLIDTALTLNAMHPDVLVVRHPESGAAA